MEAEKRLPANLALFEQLTRLRPESVLKSKHRFDQLAEVQSLGKLDFMLTGDLESSWILLPVEDRFIETLSEADRTDPVKFWSRARSYTRNFFIRKNHKCHFIDSTYFKKSLVRNQLN